VGAGRLSEGIAESVADAMFALSTPSRVQILGCLLAGQRSVSELTETLGMEQSAVSHQLRVLRDHRLVRVERDGRSRIYALYDADVVSLLEAALRHVEGRARGARQAATRLKRSESG
jgi:DNA-binding transcriptional ArsR family regulator